MVDWVRVILRNFHGLDKFMMHTHRSNSLSVCSDRETFLGIFSFCLIDTQSQGAT
jgi:hypothetical protein